MFIILPVVTICVQHFMSIESGFKKEKCILENVFEICQKYAKFRKYAKHKFYMQSNFKICQICQISHIIRQYGNPGGQKPELNASVHEP